MKIPSPYFKNLPNIGNLQMDFIIFEMDYPILFTCKDSKGNLYLCVCCEVRENQKWVVSPIEVESLIGMLEDRVTIYDAFASGNGKRYIVTWGFGYETEHVDVVNFSGIDRLDLPAKGEYLEAEEHEFDDYIQLLQKSIDSHFIDLTTAVAYIVTSKKPSVEFTLAWNKPQNIAKDCSSEFLIQKAFASSSWSNQKVCSC